MHEMVYIYKLNSKIYKYDFKRDILRGVGFSNIFHKTQNPQDIENIKIMSVNCKYFILKCYTVKRFYTIKQATYHFTYIYYKNSSVHYYFSNYYKNINFHNFYLCKLKLHYYTIIHYYTIMLLYNTLLYYLLKIYLNFLKSDLIVSYHIFCLYSI